MEFNYKKLTEILSVTTLLLILIFSLILLFFWIGCFISWNNFIPKYVTNFAPELFFEIIFVCLCVILTIGLLIIKLPYFKKDLGKYKLYHLINTIFTFLIIIFCCISLGLDRQCTFPIERYYFLYGGIIGFIVQILNLGIVMNILIILFSIGLLIKSVIEYRDFTTLNKEYYIQKINERKQLKQQKLDAKISKLQQEKEELEDKSEKAS